MNRREMLRTAAIVAGAFPAVAATGAATSSIVALPAPQTDGGLPLMQALMRRRSSREFGSRTLGPQVLSNLLWAACGVNRPQTGMRTAPSAHNSQAIEVFAALPDGLFLYEPKQHALVLRNAADLRASTGVQAFVAHAAVNLIYVADLAKAGGTSEEHLMYTAADAGHISQNVYLFCASEGLATVVRGWVDRAALSAAMGLRADERIVLAQTVGHPVS